MRHARLPWLSLLTVILIAGCGGGGTGSGNRPPPASPPLEDPAFQANWVVIDRVATGRSIGAVAHGGAGYLAIAVDPSPGPKLVDRREILAISVDGVNWLERPIQPPGYYRSIAHGNGRYVIVGGEAAGGGQGLIVVTEDGREFREVARTAGPLRRVRHTPIGFAAVGVNGAVAFSPDGERWTEAFLGPGGLQDVGYGNGRLVAVGQFVLGISSDGATWSTLECGTQLPCQSITDPSGGQHGILALNTSEFGNGTFLATGVAGLLRSPDAATWSRAGDARDSRLSFQGGLFLELRTEPEQDRLSGPLTVSSSSEGLQWQPRTSAWRVRTDHTCATSRCLVFPELILLVP